MDRTVLVVELEIRLAGGFVFSPSCGWHVCSQAIPLERALNERLNVVSNFVRPVPSNSHAVYVLCRFGCNGFQLVE